MKTIILTQKNRVKLSPKKLEIIKFILQEFITVSFNILLLPTDTGVSATQKG